MCERRRWDCYCIWTRVTCNAFASQILGLPKTRECNLLCTQNGGIGAQVHVLGAALALALDLGRVLLLEYDPEFTLFTEDAWCGESPSLESHGLILFVQTQHHLSCCMRFQPRAVTRVRQSEGTAMPRASRHRVSQVEPRPVLGVAPSCILCTPRGMCMTICFRSFVRKLCHRTVLSFVSC